MLSSILDFLCPARVSLRIAVALLADKEELLSTQRGRLRPFRLQQMKDLAATNKTLFTDFVSKLSATSHAIHRYRERHKGKGTDKEISKMLFNLLIQQLNATDRLQDGRPPLKKGLVGVIKDNTLVAILPTQTVGAPKLK